MISIADIIRLSWETYISKFKKYLPLVLIMLFLSFIGNLANVLFLNVLAMPEWAIISAGTLVSVSISLVALIVSILYILYTDKFLDNKKIKFTLHDVRGVYWPALWMSMLAGLITAGGFLLLIVPGVLFMVWFAFVLYIAVLEKGKNWEAFKQSRELSRGRFWSVFARIVLPNLFWAIIAYLVVSGIFSVIGLFMGESLIEKSKYNTLVNIAVYFISDVASAFFAPLYIIVGTIVYREVRK